MASSFQYCLNNFLFCSLLVFFIMTPSLAKAPNSLRPRALVLPVTKDSSTLQYLTSIKQRTPLVPVRLTLDLGGHFLWVDCEQGFVSSTYKPAFCDTPICKFANSGSCSMCLSTDLCFANYTAKPGSYNNTCGLWPDNSVIPTAGNTGEIGQDVVSLHSTDGSNPTTLVSVPDLIFTCSQTFLLQGLAPGVKGMAGLGRSNIGLPSQFAAAFGLDRKFAICLSSSPRSYGAVFFGKGPYVLLPGIDVSKSLTYTPLILNPISTASAYFAGDASTEYFINVTSIKINGKVVPLNASLLTIDENGQGGTKISTVNPYTVMETSIYNSFVDVFVKQVSHIPRVPPVAPFGVCFNSTSILSTRVGPGVPPIDLVLQSENVYWRINGGNSMVQVSKDVLCLGFVNNGQSPSNPRTNIVIGGHQIEDNLLQFDLANKRLGFSSSLLGRQTTCANFNFTSIA